MSMLFAAFVSNAGSSDTVTVSGEVISQVVESPTNAYARLKVDNDGNVYRSLDTGSASWVQIDSSTDWIRPTASSPGSYRVRYTSLTGDALFSATASENTWHSMSSGDYILVQREITNGNAVNSSTFTIEIDDGTTLQDSASYTLRAEVTDFV